MSKPTLPDTGSQVLTDGELAAVTGGDEAATMTAIALAESGGNSRNSTAPTVRTTPLWGCGRMLGS